MVCLRYLAFKLPSLEDYDKQAEQYLLVSNYDAWMRQFQDFCERANSLDSKVLRRLLRGTDWDGMQGEIRGIESLGLKTGSFDEERTREFLTRSEILAGEFWERRRMVDRVLNELGCHASDG